MRGLFARAASAGTERKRSSRMNLNHDSRGQRQRDVGIGPLYDRRRRSDRLAFTQNDAVGWSGRPVSKIELGGADAGRATTKRRLRRRIPQWWKSLPQPCKRRKSS